MDCDKLHQLQEGDFQLISGGDIAPLMIGYDYVLAEKSLARIIVNLASNVNSSSARIIRRSTGEELVSHDLLTVKDTFTTDSIDELDLEGCRCFIYDRSNLFVTPKLRESLLNEDYDFLQFSGGLREFA